jgi:mycothione reductase
MVDHFSLAVIGSGSGNVAIPDHCPDGKVALIESGSFGGTCINRGCIPTKMLVYTADVAMQIRRASQFGLRAELDDVDWPAIREWVITRSAEVSQAGRKGRVESAHVELFEGNARFAGPNELVINHDIRIQADQVVIATGGHPSVPPVVANSGIAFYTSDTIMQLETLPDSMVILGGGYVAVELAHVFSALGVKICIVETSATLLGTLDSDISKRFTSVASTRWEIYFEARVTDVRSDGDSVVVHLEGGADVMGDLLLVATGRRPNTDDLCLGSAGVAVCDDGRIVVDEFGRAAPSIWALGDCSSPFELKHVANAEARTIAHNVGHPGDLLPLPHDWVPAAVFSDPQVASVGARSQDLEGRPFVEATQNFGDVAYGWALRDHEGICKLYADPDTGTLLGAHILGFQASLLIVPLIQAVAHGQRIADLARGQYWIHPALSEVIENALLKLPIDQQVASGEPH